MSVAIPAGADLRGFRWPLSALQRKLEWDLEVAAAGRAALHRQIDEMRALLGRLKEETGRQSAMTSASMRQAPNLAAHREALRYLLGLETQAADISLQLQRLDRKLIDARTEQVQLQCRLDALRALEGRAFLAYRRQALMREAREADAVWLTHHRRTGGPDSFPGAAA